MHPDCTFCKIAGKHEPKELQFESENLVVFEDLRPQAEQHLLIVPKKHITDFADSSPMDANLWTEMMTVAQNLIAKYSLKEKGYRLVINGATAGKIHHMHWHLLGGVDMTRNL